MCHADRAFGYLFGFLDNILDLGEIQKMSSEVIVGLLSCGGTLIGTLGGILASSKLTTYRISELEKKVEKHNNLVERVFRLEDNDRLLEEKISVANHRIADLEGSVKA